MAFDKTEYQREYMRKKRKAAYAASRPEIGQAKGEDGRYPDREYNENGSLKLFEQKCPLDGCKGIWAASIEVPCPYCGGSGVRRATTITR